MAWTEYFRKTFEEECTEGKPWGELYPYTLTIDTETYYTVGTISSSPTGIIYSPIITIPQPRNKVDCGVIFYVESGATGTCTLYVVYYKDADTIKDTSGIYDHFGIDLAVKEPPEQTTAYMGTITFEHNGENLLSIYVDGSKIGDINLETAKPTKFQLALQVKDVAGANVGLLLYEVVGYYEVVTPMPTFYEQLLTILFMLVFMMVFIMTMSMIIQMIRSFLEIAFPPPPTTVRPRPLTMEEIIRALGKEVEEELRKIIREEVKKALKERG